MTTMTEKQQQAAQAIEAARREGVTLTTYAKAKGLVIRELYGALANAPPFYRSGSTWSACASNFGKSAGSSAAAPPRERA